MRVIGYLPTEASARTFGDYLYVQGVENQIEEQKAQSWSIWVKEEDQIETATRLLAEFQANPADKKYHSQAKAASGLRAAEAKQEEAYRKKVRDRQELFRPITGYGFGPLTFGLIVASVVVFILSSLDESSRLLRMLTITNSPFGILPEVRHGQVWRLITPIFIHFGILHILFNMFWLRDLGSMIEGRQSTGFLALQICVIAAGSNAAEYFVNHTAAFGGMSGVVYGLLGYIWIRGKLDPASGLFLHPTTVMMMLIWYVLCWTGLLGSVANIVHTVGLLMGMAWGYLASQRSR